MIEIRKIEEKDLKAVVDIAKDNFQNVMPEFHSQNVIHKFIQHQTVDSYKSQMEWKDIFVAVSNNEVVGTGALANFGNDESPKYSVSNCYVKVNLHNQGIGRIIVEEIIKLAKQKGAEMLHCPSSNSGISFYEKIGFIKDEIQNDKVDEITWMTFVLKN